MDIPKVGVDLCTSSSWKDCTIERNVDEFDPSQHSGCWTAIGTEGSNVAHLYESPDVTAKSS